MSLIVLRNLMPDEVQAVKKSNRVYLEAYTSILMVSKERLVRGCLRP